MKLSIFRAILVVSAAAAVAAEPQILSSVLSPVLAATGLSAPIGLLKVTTDTELMREGLDFAGNLTEFTTSLISNTSDHVTQFARNGLNSTTQLGHKALKGGVQVTKQGLGFAKTVSKHVPGYSTVISMGTKVGLTGLPLVETVAEKGLTLVNKGGDKVLTLSNNAIKGGAGTVNTVAQTGIGIGRDVVDRVDKVKNKFTGTLNRYSGGILFRKTRSLGAKRRIHQESIGEK